MKTNKSNNIKAKYTDSDKYQKHFTLDDRLWIQKIITDHRDENSNLTLTLKDIGEMAQNDPSTISKEVKHKRIAKARRDYSSYSSLNYICANFDTCAEIDHISAFGKACYKKTYGSCTKTCEKYEERICENLKKFPWVCNGCPKVNGCKLNKFYYYGDVANKNYKQTLKESREGISISPIELAELNQIFDDNLKGKKQPLFHIYKTNEDKMPLSLRSIYNYIDSGIMSVKNHDLRRKVTYKPRKKKQEPKHKQDKKILEGRKYEDYIQYIMEHPNASVVEMDTVEGKKAVEGGEPESLLLTIHFIKFQLQISYKIPNKEMKNVVAVFDELKETLGEETFKMLFEVILTDNGVEFSDPVGIETNKNGEKICNVFFCHPYSSYEKGSCEKNHEYIRYYLPKGNSLNFLTQKMIYTMMSNINSIIRPGTCASAYDVMALVYGSEILDKLQIKKINPEDVICDPKIFKD